MSAYGRLAVSLAVGLSGIHVAGALFVWGFNGDAVAGIAAAVLGGVVGSRL